MEEIFTVPHCGYSWIAAKALLENLGFNVLVPPPISKYTEKLGAKYSPPDACYPYKLTLGNMIESLEKGATVIIMAGGRGGLCRLCYYSTLQKITLKKIGYKFRLITASQPHDIIKIAKEINPKISLKKTLKVIPFVWRKLKAVEKIEILARKTRPYELRNGETSKVMEGALKEVDKAQTLKEMGLVNLKINEMFKIIKRDKKDPHDILKVGILGEAFCVLEPFANKNIESKLGERGVLVSQKVSEAGWLLNTAKLNFPRWRIKHMIAPQYLNVPGGGEDQQSIGKAILYGKEGYDGLILVQPRGCMPENIAQMFLPTISQKYNIPFLALSFDENTSETAVDNRIEAFVEMIKRKKERKI
ncbi:MAG: CoA protein activase [Candidatus Pacebacteria bacterium]|nr:CoA protein activase [Candidatus Paceibacterota bacterium]